MTFWVVGVVCGYSGYLPWEMAAIGMKPSTAPKRISQVNLFIFLILAYSYLYQMPVEFSPPVRAALDFPRCN